MRSFSDAELNHCLPPLRRFALSLTRNASDAEDLVHDTVERALARAESYTPGSNLRAWLFTICRNHFLSGRRKRASAGDHVSIDDVTNPFPVAARQEDRLEVRDLSRGLATLTEADREVIATVAVGGMAYEDAARRMGVEVGTVKSRLSRARARLHTAMGRDPRLPRAA